MKHSDSTPEKIRRDAPMMLRTAFHDRVQALNQSNSWYDWKGYTSPSSYEVVEFEYFAIRNATAVFDLCPMTKYRIEGPDSEAYLNRLMTRDIGKLKVGRVGYSVWCDDQGQVQDDGTVFHLADNVYRLCSQERCLDWLCWSALGFDVQISDETAAIAALAVQGPTSCATLRAMGFDGLEMLKPFGMRNFPFANGEVMISRTGFTGDLGYEVWTTPDLALPLWDALFEAGRDHLIRAIGSQALNIARIEAGFIQAGVDFVPAEQTIRPGRARSPFELGLGWLVDFNKPHFTGRKALLAEQKNGSRHRFVKLDVEGNKPAEHSFIFNARKQVVGTVTSAAWCPSAKTNIAFASLEMPWGLPEHRLSAEIYYNRELKWTRLMAKCRVITDPVFDPERRRMTPAPSC